MTDDDRIINLLADANPVPGTAPQGATERMEADRALNRVLSSPPAHRRRPPTFAPAIGVLVVLAVVAVFLGVGNSSRTTAPPAVGLQIILRAEPTAQAPVVTPAAMSRTVGILRARLGSAFHHYQVTRLGAHNLVVTVRDAVAGGRARILALTTTPGRLFFYDWEANALTPDGATVGSRLRARDATALAISQGSGTAAPGEPGAGGLPLFQAVKLAAAQPIAPAPSNRARLGTQYYLFGAPGSAACAAAATARGTRPVQGTHCLLAGPARETSDLLPSLPIGVGKGQGQLLSVPQGTTVLQAANPNTAEQAALGDPSARFFVLRDNVALTGSDIINPQPSTDEAGNPDVRFGLKPSGREAFKKATALLALRGSMASSVGQALYQHFALALDQRLLTVPSIDFKVYPDGITTGSADITGALTTRSSRDLATELRFGALPVALGAVS